MPRLLRSRRGQVREARAWPWLALFAGIVVVGIACVFWFMREAMRNERMAERQRLADAYRSHVALLQNYLRDEAKVIAAQLDREAETPAALWFAESVRRKRATSLVVRDGTGAVLYPTDALEVTASERAQTIQAEVRALVTAGNRAGAIRTIVNEMADPEFDAAFDGQGRLTAANLELLALQLMQTATAPEFDVVARRLIGRVNDYARVTMPSSQRRFVMRELARLAPAMALFPTLEAEDLAAHYLASGTALPGDGFQPTGLADVWHIASVRGDVSGLFTTTELRTRFGKVLDAAPRITGGVVELLAPAESPSAHRSALVSVSAGNFAPGWTVALSLHDVNAFETAADRKVTRYLWTGIGVATIMAALAAAVLRAFGRQVQLARLKNDLVASVSHELKTPVTSMRVLVDSVLESNDFSPDETRDYLQLLAQENARLSRLIDNFLTFSRMERNKFCFAMDRVAPEQIVAQARAAFADRADVPHCEFQTECAANLPPVMADRDAMTTVLLNLLENAWKYSGEHKRIVLRTQQTNGAVQFAVEDNGVGIHAREARRIFRRFYQVDQSLSRTVGGCGLGLSIVDYIVRNHHGTVRVESKPGVGSTFTVELPVAPTS